MKLILWHCGSCFVYSSTEETVCRVIMHGYRRGIIMKNCNLVNYHNIHCVKNMSNINDHILLIKKRRKLFQYSGLNTKHTNKTNSVSIIIFEVYTSALQINELFKI